MTTTALDSTVLAHPARPARRGPGLVGAELLKLRRRRGLMALTALLTIAPMAVAYTILAILHSTNPAGHGPAGGIDNLGGSLDVLTGLGAIAAILIGTTGGAGDIGSGVFRELVVTGRSRRALFFARVPAGLGVVLAFVAVGFAIASAASVVFAGNLDAPGAGLLLQSAGWVALVVSTTYVLALGVASLVGSRAGSIAGLLAGLLVVSPILRAIDFLGVAREGLLTVAWSRLTPSELGLEPALPMSVGAAVVTIAVWVAVPLALGAWRTMTRDA